MLDYLGFPEKFVGWILECVTTMNYSTVTNGEYTKPFDASRGIRQGNPISLFLFTIVMEYLSRNLKLFKQDKHFKYHSLCVKLDITHLSFADNPLLFSRGDV